MPQRTTVVYAYDGSFEGLLCCVFEAFEKKEEPLDILPPDAPQSMLYPLKTIECNSEKAARVFRSIPVKISSEAEMMVRLGYFTCEPQKELLIYRFLRMGFRLGGRVVNMLTDDTVCALHKAVNHLTRESHKLKGFVRFSDYGGVLVSVIEPKNYVLPLLQQHFSGRYRCEAFMIYDKTHRVALVSRGGEAEIYPLEDFTPPAPDAAEVTYRKLWKRFYDTIAIEGRYNPRCRMSFMPKRYWKHLTEMNEQPDLPEQLGCQNQQKQMIE